MNGPFNFTLQNYSIFRTFMLFEREEFLIDSSESQCFTQNNRKKGVN